MHVGAYTDNTVGIQILGSVLAHVRNIRSQLLDARLVSRTSMMYSSTWTEVKMSSR